MHPLGARWQQRYSMAEPNTSSKKHYIPWIATAVLCFLLILFFVMKNEPNPPVVATQLELPSIQIDMDELSAEEEEPKALSGELDNDEKDDGWRTITTRKGDTLAKIFKREGLSQQTLVAILHANPYSKTLTSIKPNQSFQIQIHDNILEKMVMHYSPTQLLVITLKKQHYDTSLKNRTMDTQEEFVTATVKGSLYSTAARQGISAKLIRQMVDIFHWEIDFSREVRAGDQFSILYQAQYVDDNLVNVGNILALSYTHRGTVHAAVRYKNAHGDYDYFTPNGNSLKKAFSRYPLQFTHISSPFSLSRQHPILHYSRPHKGVDLAAPIGTPIRSTGDGIISQIGRQNAYGNMITITHSNMYSSLYGHLLRFQKGLSRGSRVKRGQIIGYVGQSGLATGPHCHYEFHVYHQARNPMTIALPHADPIAKKNLGSFKNNANRILASLKLFESGNMIAARSGKTSQTG